MKRRIGSLTILMTIATALAAVVPRPSPDFPMNLPGSGKISIAQYRGKIVLLVFISPT